MKKLCYTICLLIVATATLQAMNANEQKLLLKCEPRPERIETDITAPGVSSLKNTSWFTPSTPYNYGYHGYSQYRMDGDRISWDPNTGLYGTVFDPKSTTGIKSTGVMAGTWDTENSSSIVNPFDQTGRWYRFPDICGYEKYQVAIMGTKDVTPDNQYLYISVYDHDEQLWTPQIPVKTGASTPSKVFSAHGSMTKDNNGMYHLMLTVVYENTAYTNRKLAIIVGKTTDPYNGTWTFTDYAANSFTVGAGNQLTEASSVIKGAWGKNGFGFAAVQCDVDGVTSGTVSYVYTDDYGQSWKKDTDGKMYVVPVQSLFPWIGTTFGDDNTVIEQAVLAGNIAVNVDQNNDAQIMVHVWGGQGTSYWPNMGMNGNGVFTAGYYNLNYKFDQNGAPETNAQWSANMIAQGVGFDINDDDPNAENSGPESAYINNRAMSISCGNDNVLVACWTDRPKTNALHQTVLGTQLGIPQDNWHEWVHNPYISFSLDGGTTWKYSVDSLRRGFEINNYSDNKIQELGFTIAKNSRIEGIGENRLLETYASYSIPNLQVGCPADLGFTPGSEHSFWEQSWYIMKISVSGDAGIETEVTALEKNFTLSQNYPNPFNPTTAINFNLQTPANVKLSVFNAQGQEVANLINAKMDQGAHTANFNAANLNSGVYFYKLSVDGQSAVKKMVLTK